MYYIATIMKTIYSKQYEADDGEVFALPSECKQYEYLKPLVLELMNMLGDREVIFKYIRENGVDVAKCYVKHRPELVLQVKKGLIKLIRNHFGYDSDFQNLYNKFMNEKVGTKDNVEWYDIGVLLRYLPCRNPLQRFLIRQLNRFACFDNYYREWEQPYYANLPVEQQQPHCHVEYCYSVTPKIYTE